MLTSKQAEILITLIKAEQYLSAETIADLCNISSRMVLYHVDILKTWLRNYRFNLESKAGLGIRLFIPEIRKVDLLKDVIEKTNYLCKQERINIIIFFLIINPGFYSVSSLAEKLSVSSDTIRRDLISLKSRKSSLLNTDIYLNDESECLTLKGRESCIRHLWIILVSRLFSEYSLIDYCLWGKSLANTIAINNIAQKKIVIKEFPWEQLKICWSFVSGFRRKIACKLNDNDHLALTLYICIMHWRIKNKEFIDTDEVSTTSLDESLEMIEVNRVFDDIENISNTVVSKKERTYFALMFFSSVEISENSNILDWFPQELSLKTNRYLGELIKRTSQKLGIYTTKHSKYAEEKLRNHFYRLVFSLFLNRPLKTSIPIMESEKLIRLSKIVSNVVKDLNKEYCLFIPNEEVGYLTLYLEILFSSQQSPGERKPRVIVCCPSGGVTVWYLLERLGQEFPQLEIIDVISISELPKYKEINVDAIISTEKINWGKVKVITVSPLITQEEIIMITKELLNNLNL
jgi:transcriptional antiterminator